MAIENCSSDEELDWMRQRGWIERKREPRPLEGRVLITLWHPRQTLGEGADRHVSAVETFSSLLLDQPAPSQLTLFGDPR
jgi:hypothetical protein